MIKIIQHHPFQQNLVISPLHSTLGKIIQCGFSDKSMKIHSILQKCIRPLKSLSTRKHQLSVV